VAFAGWPAEAVEFYEGLEADNSKSYWHAHKAVYDELVHAPMSELLAELEPEFGEGKIFRPYRDLRFSRDKSPYKTAMGATLADGGYVQFSAAGLAAGAGMFGLAGERLSRFRQAVDEDASGRELSAIVATLAAAGIGVTAHDILKTVPKGFAKDHPRAGLLRHKGLIAWRQWQAGAWLGTSEAKTRVVGFLRAATALGDWLTAHVGPADGQPG
jgi:uncharacterized protein (TIGR02453 family)